jgi:EAL domain-containing protein (putative c-di-GMP-specific phosphodiesterase class I)
MASFTTQAAEGWLFLNVSPDSMSDRNEVIREFGGWLEETGLAPHQIVVEIIETRSVDECQLAEAVSGFRELGCLVAIDDFGAGESNFERVWRFRPDLVKLDRAMISEAAVNPVVQRILPGIVSLIHEAGCLVVMEGIETERQALIAVESDVDFVQGFYFSRPQSRYSATNDIRAQFDELSNHIRSTREERSAMDRGFFAGYMGALEACVSALEDGIGFHDACAMFLAVSGVQRVYELDAEGYQVGSNAESTTQGKADPRFAPCADGAGANWFRRPYFQRAIAQPRRVQISRPYLSIRDARSCVTMSVAFEDTNRLRVLCADLDYEHAEPPSQRSGFESSVDIRY